jgi:hypothetical protein
MSDYSSAPCSEDRPKGGDSAPHASDPALIPHDIENRGVATGIDPQLNPQISGPFPPPHQVANRPGSTSQGGDTGSNPVGTTNARPEVRALVLDRSAC